MWIARDKDGGLFLYEYAPIKGEEGWKTVRGTYYPIPRITYPEIKWSDSKAKQLVIKND